MATELDPYTKVYNRIESLLKESERVSESVKSANIIAFNDKQQPIVDNPQHGQLPEILIVSSGMAEGNLKNTSSSSKVVRKYSLIVSTGDLRITKYLLPIEWAITCALTNWNKQFGSLTWNDKAFVKRVNVTDSDIGINDDDRNRGIKGWSELLTVEVEMHFSTIDMQGY